MVTDEELAMRAEKATWDHEDWNPPGFEMIDRPDLIMWTTPVSNQVALSIASEDEVEERIDEVLRYYTDRGRKPSWFVGPSSRPLDLEDRLLRRGFRRTVTLRLLGAELPISGLHRSDVVVVDVTDRRGIEDYVEIATPRTDPAFEARVEEWMAYLAFGPERGGLVTAYIGDECVGKAHWRMSEDMQCLYLSGAETKEAYRGRGIYSTLVDHRQRLAMARGARMATIQANVETSMPILLKRGFRDLHLSTLRLDLLEP